MNYLRNEDVRAISLVDLSVNHPLNRRTLLADHPLLIYVVEYIFLHAARAEEHGISQERFRNYICTNRECFERWRYLYDALVDRDVAQGPHARPIHIFSEYGLLTRGVAEKERNVDTAGGAFGSALSAACYYGHSDTVRILLEYEADPRIEAYFWRPVHNTRYYPSVWAMASLAFAISRQHLPVLRLLLNDERSCFTLQERFAVSVYIDKDYIFLRTRARSHIDHSDEILALLFPETSFPESIIQDLYEVARASTPAVFSFLLGKFDESIVQSIVHGEEIWHHVLDSGFPQSISKIKVLLDRGGRIKITSALIETFGKSDIHEAVSESVSEAFSLLLRDCEAEMTEGLVNSISGFEGSSQIVRIFEAAGYRFDPFTPQQLLLVLRSGSAESAAFFLQHQYDGISVDEMLESALSNERHGGEVTLLLLGYRNPDCLNERAIMTAVANRRCGGGLMRLLHSRWSNLRFSEAALAVAARCQPPSVVEFVLEHCKVVKITEEILTAAASNYRNDKNLELLLLHDSAICIQESTVIAAIDNGQGKIRILDRFCVRGKSLSCTEKIVAHAAKCMWGPDALDIVLEQDRDAKISSSMIMIAMQAKRGAALTSVMLRHDHTIVIKEEHLLAAASNSYEPHAIFALLQNRGQLDQADKFHDINRAKRRRTSRKTSPCISIDVINAAFSNPDEAARGRLLELFVDWGVITQADLDSRMYIAPFTIRPDWYTSHL